ncbi:LacI family DNA-binding transcriptional regulator [Planctomonas sp. JC2975]|uniref:LacI family DNA-binding transcriptional regulator n=1 Tax=Planctomonas sp. JC2975 TaxID=2729626 RepID=UPI003211F4BD
MNPKRVNQRQGSAIATIKDVAKAAGVSPSTVSNLLNARDHLMQPETRRRVLEAMEALSYRPSRIAQQLRGAPNLTFGLIVPSVANPFWGSWAAYLETAAHARGRQIYLCNTERDPDRERAYVEQLWADGVEHIVLSTSLPSLEHLRPAMDAGVQIVAFDREREETDPPELLSVSVDNEAGAWMATQHLVERGHRRIAFVSGAIRTVSRVRRFAGYRRALAENGIQLDEALVSDSPELGDTDSGSLAREAVHALFELQDPPTALVTINDMFALGAVAAIRDAGRDVTDVAVVGFDDIPIGGLISPTLSTVHQPLREMAEAVVALTINEARAGESLHSLVFAPTLVERESTSRRNT